MCVLEKGVPQASWIMPSTKLAIAYPEAAPQAVRVMRGARHRLHPARTMHCSSPARIAWARSITPLRPDPHTLLMVRAGTVPEGLRGSPPGVPAPGRRRPGDVPHDHFVDRTAIDPGAGATASRITRAPSRGAGSGASPPRYFRWASGRR